MIFNKYKMSDLGTVYSGGTPSTKISEYWDGIISWITPKDLSNYNSKYISNGERMITELGMNKSSATLIPKGSVLMSSRAPIGYVVINQKEVTTNQGFKSIHCDEEKCLNEYMYYWIKSNVDYITSKSNGSTFKEISGSAFKELIVDVPSLENQKRIVEIIGNIDNKIELNNEINNNLYDLLKNEFRSKYYSVDGEKVVLGELIENTIGGDWGKETPQGNNNTKVYCVRGADIPNMEYGNKGNTPERYILEKNYINKKLEANNIIVEISGGSPTQSTGRTAYITENILNMYDSPLLCTNFCKAMKIKDEKKAPFVYMIFKLQYEDGIFFSWENGTTGIKNFALNDMMNNTEVVLPSDEDIEKYYELFNTIMNKIAANSKQNQVLEQLRDTLLPKLMNGEIDLNNIEI